MINKCKLRKCNSVRRKIPTYIIYECVILRKSYAKILCHHRKNSNDSQCEIPPFENADENWRKHKRCQQSTQHRRCTNNAVATGIPVVNMVDIDI